jgi:hypothetical protein
MVSHNLVQVAARLVVSVSAVAGASIVNALDVPYQQPPLALVASELLPKSVLSGDGYTLDERVINDGVQNTYTLQSHYGVLTVTGTDELLARIQEVRSTMALEKLENSEEFKAAAKNSVTGLVAGGKALIEEPGDTARGAAKGVGRWLQNVGSAVISDDPHQDNVLETAVGFDARKRAYAVAMGVDPYTEFEPFQQHLGEVASAATAGGMVTSMAISLGSKGLVSAVTSVSRAASMENMLKDNAPSGLAQINRDKLLGMGIQGYQADALLKNYNYTPAEMSLLCDALQRMGDIEGREIFVAFATSAPDHEVANFMQYYADMLADYITTVETGDIIDVFGKAWLVSRSGSLVGVFPLDYMAWTPGVDQSVAAASSQMSKNGAKGKQLLLRGQASPQARAALESRGWQITENVRFADVAD